MDLDNVDPYIISFGKNLQFVRRKNKVSLRKLESLSNIDSSQIHRIEKGIANPTLKTILALAIALHINPYDLFTFFLNDSEKNI